MGTMKFMACEPMAALRTQSMGEELLEMVEAYTALCNLYAIARRPRVALTEGTLSVDRHGHLSTTATVNEAEGRSVHRVQLPFVTINDGKTVFDLGEYPTPCPDLAGTRLRRPRKSRLELKTPSGSDYFQIRDRQDGQIVLHGDPWHITLLGSGYSSRFSDLEVLYVGEALGDKKARSWAERISRGHSTLQKIYQDHLGGPWDIFVIPIAATASSSSLELSTSADFALAQQLPAIGMRAFRSDREIYIELIHLLEASLIAYFRPEYNQRHVDTFPSKRGKIESILSDLDYTSLTLECDTSPTGFRLWSQARQPRWWHSNTFTVRSRGIVTDEEFAEADKSARQSLLPSILLAEESAVPGSSSMLMPMTTPKRVREKDFGPALFLAGSMDRIPAHPSI